MAERYFNLILILAFIFPCVFSEGSYNLDVIGDIGGEWSSVCEGYYPEHQAVECAQLIPNDTSFKGFWLGCFADRPVPCSVTRNLTTAKNFSAIGISSYIAGSASVEVEIVKEVGKKTIFFKDKGWTDINELHDISDQYDVKAVKITLEYLSTTLYSVLNRVWISEEFITPSPTPEDPPTTTTETTTTDDSTVTEESTTPETTPTTTSTEEPTTTSTELTTTSTEPTTTFTEDSTTSTEEPTTTSTEPTTTSTEPTTISTEPTTTSTEPTTISTEEPTTTSTEEPATTSTDPTTTSTEPTTILTENPTTPNTDEPTSSTTEQPTTIATTSSTEPGPITPEEPSTTTQQVPASTTTQTTPSKYSTFPTLRPNPSTTPYHPLVTGDSEIPVFYICLGVLAFLVVLQFLFRNCKRDSKPQQNQPHTQRKLDIMPHQNLYPQPSQFPSELYNPHAFPPNPVISYTKIPYNFHENPRIQNLSHDPRFVKVLPTGHQQPTFPLTNQITPIAFTPESRRGQRIWFTQAGLSQQYGYGTGQQYFPRLAKDYY